MKWPALVLSVLCCLGSFSAFAAAPAGANVQIDPSVRMEKLDDYYITKAVRMIRLQPFCKIFLPSVGPFGRLLFPH